MSQGILEASDETFQQEIQGAVPVLVDFWAPWCGPCQRVAPVVEALAKANAGKLKVIKVNVDNCQQTAAQFQIMSIPTLLVFKGGKVVEQMVGAQSQAAIEQKIKKYMG
jgi:thioredoxin